MEDRLKQYIRTKKIRQYRVYILISLLTIDLAGIADALLIPELQDQFAVLRYGVLTPLGFMVLLFTQQRFWQDREKYLEVLLAVIIFGEGVALVWIHGQATFNSVYFYKSTLFLHIILMYLLSNLRLSYVLPLGISFVLGYNLWVIPQGSVPSLEFMESNMAFVIGNLIGIVFCAIRDFQLRAQSSLLSDILQKGERAADEEHKDPLTKLYLRDRFEEKAKALYVMENLPITVVIGDVNGLKGLNDTFGFKVGDELLRTLAQSMQSVCGPQDLAGRMGGDEFAIFLPLTNKVEASKRISHIMQRLRDSDIQSLGISVSFGSETVEDLNRKLCDVYKIAENKLYKNKLLEFPSVRGRTIQAILHTLHEKNKREERHSRRVSKLCESMGRHLQLSDEEVKELRTVGLLHDIGKVAIEEDILNKPGRLTLEEYSVVKTHPTIGFRILNSVGDMEDIAHYVLCHHERWDGKGYPMGLKGDEIPLQSRIIALADTFDAMTSDRSYRKGLPQEVAIQEIINNSGTQFDPELVKAFLEMLKSPMRHRQKLCSNQKINLLVK